MPNPEVVLFKSMDNQLVLNDTSISWLWGTEQAGQCLSYTTCIMRHQNMAPLSEAI